MDRSVHSANPTAVVLVGIVAALAAAAALWAISGWVAASPVLIAAATVYGSWFATREAHRLDRERRRTEASRRRSALLRALRTELAVTWGRYEEAVGWEVEEHPPDQPYGLFFRANREYLHVYRASAGRLGEIEDDRLRDAIERAYIYITVLLEQHDMAHEGSTILNRNAEAGKITPESARERSTELAQLVKQAREQATHHVSEATALLDEALKSADE